LFRDSQPGQNDPLIITLKKSINIKEQFLWLVSNA
jgi:hypothetical protein